MKRRERHVLLGALLLLCLAGLFLWPASPAHAQASIAMVSDVSGTVLVCSGDQMTQISRTRTPVSSMDLLMTREGAARITFGDGAVLNLSSFSVVQIRQGLESGGKLTDSQKPVRRIPMYFGRKLGSRIATSSDPLPLNSLDAWPMKSSYDFR